MSELPARCTSRGRRAAARGGESAREASRKGVRGTPLGAISSTSRSRLCRECERSSHPNTNFGREVLGTGTRSSKTERAATARGLLLELAWARPHARRAKYTKNTNQTKQLQEVEPAYRGLSGK